MPEPWIEVEPCHPRADDFDQGYSQQASFALIFCVPGFPEWVSLKWGFNAAALLEEAMDRQKLFIESLHEIDPDLRMEYPEHRTLAIRYLAVPNAGLLPVIVGKVRGKSIAQATQHAQAFYRKLCATLPYEYSVSPVLTRDEFYRVSGRQLLSKADRDLHLLQIKRCEMPFQWNASGSFLQGFWNSTDRAHEQVWRLLSVIPHPSLLSIMLRPTVLYPKELEVLWKLQNRMASNDPDDLSEEEKKWSSLYSSWGEEILKRKLTPWKKVYYLQIFMISDRPIDDEVAHGIGSVLTLNTPTGSQPGYQIVRPLDDQKREWAEHIFSLDVLYSGSRLPAPRLSEVADLEEAFAVLRLPYSPPEQGLPGVNFIQQIGG